MENKKEVILPEKQPYEGRATQKQKQKLWDLGFDDQRVIDDLGKRQASFLIDQIISQGRAGHLRQTSPRLMWSGVILAVIGAIIFYVSRGSRTTTFWSFISICAVGGGGLMFLGGIDRLIASRRK